MDTYKRILSLVLICLLFLSGYPVSTASALENTSRVVTPHFLKTEGVREEVANNDIISILLHQPYLDAIGVEVHYESDRKNA